MPIFALPPPFPERPRSHLLPPPSVPDTPKSAPSRSFAASSDDAHKPHALRNPELVNFSLSDSEDEEAEGDGVGKAATSIPTYGAKRPPPYDPFGKKPVVEEPEDPKNLQEIFHKMRTEGLNDYAVKMFDALSKDGRTHEALELFRQIKDKGHMPDVVAHTAVIEAYCNAGGQSKEALKVKNDRREDNLVLEYCLGIRGSIYFNSFREVYEAWVIYNFLSLCLAWVGGPGAVVLSLSGRVLKPSLFLMTCCFPPLPLDGRPMERFSAGWMPKQSFSSIQ